MCILIQSCNKEPGVSHNLAPHIYVDFESDQEPFDQIESRAANAMDEGNGCMDGSLWNEHYKLNVCISPNVDSRSAFAIERSDLHARSGESSLRFMLRPSDPDNWPIGEATHRAELSPISSNFISRYPTEGEERWYGLSVYFPRDFVFASAGQESNLRFSLAQWQHGTEGSPIFALEVYGNQLAVARTYGLSTDSGWVPPEYLSEIKLGEWMDIVVRIGWSKQEGNIKTWINGRERFSKSHVQTIYKDLEIGGGFKVGIYYWRWKEKESVIESLRAGINEREIFIDEIREYIGRDGYSAAAPANEF